MNIKQHSESELCGEQYPSLDKIMMHAKKLLTNKYQNENMLPSAFEIRTTSHRVISVGNNMVQGYFAYQNNDILYVTWNKPFFYGLYLK